MRGRLLWMLVLTGCGTTRMRLEVLRPPTVVVPDSIERIAVLNRAGSGGPGVGKPPPRAPAEPGGMPQRPNDAGRAAADALQQELHDSDRFISRPVPEPPPVHPGPMNQEEVVHYCEVSGADALISLESLQAEDRKRVRSQESQPYRATPGQMRPVTTWTVEREVDLQVHWRLYDPRRSVPFDDWHHRQPRARYTAHGPNPVDAERRLGLPMESHARAAEQAGRDYAARILPTLDVVERVLFVAGSPELRTGVRQARLGDWPGAEAAWSRATEDSDPRVRASAWKNLAVASEVAGSFGQAVAHLDRALTLEESTELRRYRAELAKRSSALLPEEGPDVVDAPTAPQQVELPLAVPVTNAQAEQPLSPP